MKNSSSGNGVIYTKERRGMRIENPFTLKVGQVFTGFGIGCGVGIGVGRPLNLGAIPVLNQVMVATRGATDAFSGVQIHVNSFLRKVGAKNIEAGIGCGVGFGHGFGVGLGVKPSVLLQLKSHVLEGITGVITKLGIGSTLSANQSILPPSLLTEMSIVKEPQHENTNQLVKSASKDPLLNTQYSSRTEKVIDNFLKSPLLKEERGPVYEPAGPQQFENKVLQMVLKHQLLIEDLMQENEKLRQILVKDLKVQPSNFESCFTSVRHTTSCTECFECRRKQRKR